MEFAPGTSFGRYTIEAAIGQGGMGRVFLARDNVLERNVALKIVRPDREVDEETAARFMREAKLAARLAHPNTVHVYDMGEVEGVPFIAMEHVSGKTLFAYVGDSSVPAARKLRWLLDVARGLAAAHGCGLLHRDVKPTNVIVSNDGVAKILDFGLAKRIETTPEIRATFQTTLGFVVGTPAYMAPEQLEERDTDARADQFSWAITAMMVLDGQNPRAVDPLLLSPIPPLAGRVPGVSDRASSVIQRAIAIDREERFPTMADLVAALDAALTEDLLRTSAPTAEALPETEDAPAASPAPGVSRSTQPLRPVPSAPVSSLPGPSPRASDVPSPPTAMNRERPATLVTTGDGRFVVVAPGAHSVRASQPPSTLKTPAPPAPPGAAAPIAPMGTVVLGNTPLATIADPKLAERFANVARRSAMSPNATVVLGHSPNAIPAPPANATVMIDRTPPPPPPHPSAERPPSVTPVLGEENPFARARMDWASEVERSRETPEARRAQRWRFERRPLACPFTPLARAVFSTDGRRVAAIGPPGLTLNDGGGWYGGPRLAPALAAVSHALLLLPQHRVAIAGDGFFACSERDGTWSIARDGFPPDARFTGAAYSPRPTPHVYFVGETSDGGVVVRASLDGSVLAAITTERALTAVAAAPLSFACGPRGIVRIEDGRAVPLMTRFSAHAMAVLDDDHAFVAGEESAYEVCRTGEFTVRAAELPQAQRLRLLASDQHRDIWMLSHTGLIFRRIVTEWVLIGSVDADAEPPIALWVSAKRVRIVTAGGTLIEGRRE